jgi:hypothetical protein
MYDTVRLVQLHDVPTAVETTVQYRTIKETGTGSYCLLVPGTWYRLPVHFYVGYELLIFIYFWLSRIFTLLINMN